MTTCSNATVNHAGRAFDTIAEQYDDLFTRSLVGRAQRDAVWDVMRQTFRSGDRILELNCGTGEDALFLARMGVSVFACDASERMISVAARRMTVESATDQVQLEVRSTEQIGELSSGASFDGALSNFSGLNCVADLAAVARQLAALIRPGGCLLLCLSSRICLWETLWYLAHGEITRATRRWKGIATASLGETPVCVLYPTMKDLEQHFRPSFAVRVCKGVGVSVPPSYVEHVARQYPRVLRGLQMIDRAVAGWPIVRAIGDHTLFVLERSGV